jgi:NAD(P)-dependent dehydrogenase (short-subunit alcohol dehydrogenase family)
MDLYNKVVLITGAGHPNGIGGGIARCFAAEGAKVVVTDLPGAPLQKSLAVIGAQAIGITANAASQSEMSDAVKQVIDQLGSLDVLVNNAGIGGPTLDEPSEKSGAGFMSASDEDWDNQLAANLRTTFSSSRAAIPHLSDGGSIVNIASIAALAPSVSLAAYGAAKAGVVHLTKTLAMELAPRRIRVNCICPGLLYTRAWEMLTERMKQENEAFAGMTNRQIFETIVTKMTPMGGEQTPQDIGNLAVFYASEKARMITGQNVAVDGGISIAGRL